MRKSFRSSYLRGEEQETDQDLAFPDERETARKKVLDAVREKRYGKEKIGARAGMILAPLTMGYAIYAHDVPAFFLGAALILVIGQPFARKYLGKHGDFIAKILYTFAVTLFLGAILLIFI
ncbi:hypothetical protein TAMA11512_07390 [Selenomonas sp. TAMA-11512]|uniref:hypothetical protein n=1 Tax=Selenomonas sp. TAMA-11512 TaxID=3095337 RepID=UPI003090E8B2|nr:hypothetical protein TAMA11512_07390 [Selenomonas sp. TAMA-11512]